jgi:hypothetical protein
MKSNCISEILNDRTSDTRNGRWSNGANYVFFLYENYHVAKKLCQKVMLFFCKIVYNINNI